MKTVIPNVSLICTCCEFQSEIDDNKIGYTLEWYRTEWIEGGAEWFKETKKPSDWDLIKQLNNLVAFTPLHRA